MMENEFEKIEAFLNNEMDNAEKKAFEEALQRDSALAKHLQLYNEIQNTLRDSEVNKDNENLLRQSIQHIHKEHIAKPAKVVTLKKISRWFIAAAAIFIIAIAGYFFNKKNNASSAELYASYATFPPLSVERGNNDSLLSKGIALYNNKSYADASVLLKQYVVKDSSDKEIVIAYYICKLQTNNLNEALQGFSNIASTENVFTSQANWYLALTYLKQDNVNGCKKILRQISPGADTYARAQQLLKKL